MPTCKRCSKLSELRASNQAIRAFPATWFSHFLPFMNSSGVKVFRTASGPSAAARLRHTAVSFSTSAKLPPWARRLTTNIAQTIGTRRFSGILIKRVQGFGSLMTRDALWEIKIVVLRCAICQHVGHARHKRQLERSDGPLRPRQPHAT